MSIFSKLFNNKTNGQKQELTNAQKRMIELYEKNEGIAFFESKSEPNRYLRVRWLEGIEHIKEHSYFDVVEFNHPLKRYEASSLWGGSFEMDYEELLDGYKAYNNSQFDDLCKQFEEEQDRQVDEHVSQLERGAYYHFESLKPTDENYLVKIGDIHKKDGQYYIDGLCSDCTGLVTHPKLFKYTYEMINKLQPGRGTTVINDIKEGNEV